MYRVKKYTSKEQLQWILTEYLPNYCYQCGDTLYPDNDINTVDLPNESWKDPKCMIEFRHKLKCSSLLEVQIDTFSEDGAIKLRCCHCGTVNIDFAI